MADIQALIHARQTTRRGTRTFEVLVQELSAIGEVVHDVDLEEGKFGRADAGGTAALIYGLARLSRICSASNGQPAV